MTNEIKTATPTGPVRQGGAAGQGGVAGQGVSGPGAVLGVDNQVLLAAREMGEEERAQPEWLWHRMEQRSVQYGRWARHSEGVHAPYIRADLVLQAIASTPAPDGTPSGPAAVALKINTDKPGEPKAKQ